MLYFDYMYCVEFGCNIEVEDFDQSPAGPITLGNRDCKANVNVDFGDLIIKGLQVEESRKAKKQVKVEKRGRATKKPGIPAGHAFQAESGDKVGAQTRDFE